LDHAKLEHPLRRHALYMLQHLADQSRRFPPALLLPCNGDLVEEEIAFREGGFGRTYRGMFGSAEVLIKKLRPGQDASVTYENHRVRLSSTAYVWLKSLCSREFVEKPLYGGSLDTVVYRIFSA
jgi:hypothetical protein